jgi:type IV secretory pathway VirB6-like protein
MGAADYSMTQLQVEAYMSQFSQEQLAYFYSFPAWTNAAWAVGVWGSVTGSVGLLLRKRWAQWAFAASIGGLLGTSLYTMALTDGIAVMGGIGPLLFSVVIWAFTIALFFYARAMARRGVLR